MWRPNGVPKSSYGYLGGIILIIIYYFISKFIESHLDNGQKYSFKRKVVEKGRKVVGSAIYVASSVILFLISIVLLADLIFSH